MPVSMAVKVDGERAMRALGGLALGVRELDEVRRDFAEHIVTSVKRNFRAGGRPRAWQPSLRALLTGGKTLIKTGRLMRSISGRVRGEQVLVGTNVVYGRVHQLGFKGVVRQMVKAHTRRLQSGKTVQVKAHGRTMRVRLVARPYLLVQREDRRYLNRSIMRHFARSHRMGWQVGR